MLVHFVSGLSSPIVDNALRLRFSTIMIFFIYNMDSNWLDASAPEGLQPPELLGTALQLSAGRRFRVESAPSQPERGRIEVRSLGRATQR